MEESVGPSAPCCTLIVPFFPPLMTRMKGPDCKLISHRDDFALFYLNEGVNLHIHLPCLLISCWYPTYSTGFYIDLRRCRFSRSRTMLPLIRFLNLYHRNTSLPSGISDISREAEGHFGICQEVPGLLEICRISLLHSVCAGMSYENAATVQKVLVSTLSLMPGFEMLEWEEFIEEAKRKGREMESEGYCEARNRYEVTKNVHQPMCINLKSIVNDISF